MSPTSTTLHSSSRVDSAQLRSAAISLPGKIKEMKNLSVAAYLLVTPCLMTALGLSHAQATQDCTQIENARERLACFDQQFPRTERPTSLPQIRSEPIKAPTTLGTRPPASPEFSAVESTRTQPLPAPQPQRNSVLSWDTQLDFETQLVAIRRGDQQRMVFRLANGQIWMQNSPRDQPFQSGDTVTVKSARLGGYIMRNDRGTSARVRRIE